MKKEEKEALATAIAKDANYQEHSVQLMIPLLRGLNVKEVDGSPQVIMFAEGEGYCEQLVSDGYIDSDKYESSIEETIKSAKDFMKDIECFDVDSSFIYYKDYNNGIFSFKIYVQDVIFEDEGKKIIRQMNAYFYEPNMSDFYQFSLSTGPYDFDNSKIKTGVIDLENNPITKELEKKMMNLLSCLKYQK